MKSLHLSLVITAVVSTSLIIIFGVIIFLQPASKAGDYEYVIHEPYEGVNKDLGTVIIENQTYHVINLNKATNNVTRPFWIEMYNVNFSFPEGIEPQNTPGGQIFETYVTFPDNPVPYRLGVGLGPSPSGPNYDFTTVLSTHANPQAGFTIHKGTIQLLVNWSKIHSNVNIIGINDTYTSGQPIDFIIRASGFDYFNAGETPDINITRADGTLVWQNSHLLVMCCVPELTDYDKTINFTNMNIKGPIILNETGLYKITVRYNFQTVEKDFAVLDPVRGIKFDCKKPLGIQMDATYKYLNQTKAIDLAKTSPDFQSMASKYDVLDFNSIFNGFLTGDPCNSYWENVNVVFSGNHHADNYPWNIQVTEDPSLTRILNVTEYKSGYAR